MLLGEPMRQFHAELAAFHKSHPNFRYHYVTAWEMAQLVHQAERGVTKPAIVAERYVSGVSQLCRR
jgi:hypothetical protein